MAALKPAALALALYAQTCTAARAANVPLTLTSLSLYIA